LFFPNPSLRSQRSSNADAHFRKACESHFHSDRRGVDPSRYSASDGGSAQRIGRLRWAESLIRYELWVDLITATTSGELDWSADPFEQAMRAYSLGLSYAANGDPPKLADQIAALKRLAADQATPSAAGRGRMKYEVELGTASSNMDEAEVARQISAKFKAAASARAKGYEGAAASSVASEVAGRMPGRLGDGTELTLSAALAELEGDQLLARGDAAAAFVSFSKVTAMRPEARARAHLRVRNYAFAESSSAIGVERSPGQFSQLASHVEILHAVGKNKEALGAYRQLEPMMPGADPDVPLRQRLASIVAGIGANGRVAGSPSGVAGERSSHRVDLATLGPLTWLPWAAPEFLRSDADGKSWTLAEHRGRTVVLLLYLGGRCAHCMQQLQEFGKHSEGLKSLGADLVAVSTDDGDATKALAKNSDGVRFPMPLLADPALGVFKAYRSFDDFEGQPLDGVFLIDARGAVRYQRISADPFIDVSYIEGEIKRIRRFNP
jgi:peroxiredoxin